MTFFLVLVGAVSPAPPWVPDTPRPAPAGVINSQP